MMRFLRSLVPVLTCVLIVACGAPAASTSPTASSANATTAPSTSASFPVTIKHARGEATIEKPVSRIVAISDEAADIVVASGLKPVGVGTYRVEGSLGQPIAKSGYFDMGQAVYVGDGGAPSLEAIAALKPDLILYLLDRTADIYDKLTPIAPTLAIDSNSKDYWRPIMQDLGRVTGNETQVEQFLTEYDASAKAARERVASLAQKSPKLALLYLPAADSTFVFDERSSVSSPYVKLGFTMVAPEGTVIPENGFAQVAAEAIANIKADTIVALRFVDEAGNPLPLPIDPILNSLPNVRIVTQPLDPTRSSSAPLADKLALEQAAEILVPDSSAGGSSKN